MKNDIPKNLRLRPARGDLTLHQMECNETMNLYPKIINYLDIYFIKKN